jgi:hypothetical protein
MRKITLTPILIQSALLFSLLVASPFAMSFTAYQGICNNMPLQADPLYTLRATLIIAALIVALLSLTLLIWYLVKTRHQILHTDMADGVALQMSMTICSLTIGWVAFPYWVNGVYQAYRGIGTDECTLQAYDPKFLMPTIWIGGIWALGVLFTFGSTLFMGTIIMFETMEVWSKKRDWIHCLPTIICLAITVGVYLICPDYWIWLID